MGTTSRDYALSTNLGKMSEITYNDGILHFLFEKGEIRLELSRKELFHFLKPKFQFTDEK
jgi:hypothetical protein